MGLLLDTNVVSDMRRPEKTSATFRANVGALPVAQTFLSVMTLTEVRLGIQRQESRDIRFALALEAWLRLALIETFQGRR